MMSMLQQRQLIEASFAPYVCRCTICPRGYVSIQLTEAQTAAIILNVTGISTSALMSWESICKLEADVKNDLHTLKSGIGARNVGLAARGLEASKVREI